MAGPGQPLPTIFADRSDFQDLIEIRPQYRAPGRRCHGAGRAASSPTTRRAINRTVQNIEKFSQALGENADGIDSFLAQVGQAAEKVGPLAEKLETLATNLDEVVRSVDRERVARIVENVDNFTTSLSDSRDDISKALADAATLVGRLNETAPKLDTALADINNIAKAIDPAKIGRAVDNADVFSRTLRERSPDVDKAIPEARSITEKLNKSADKIDAVLDGAEKFLGSASGEEGQGAFEQIKAAAESVRVLADNLNRADQPGS